MKKIEEADFYWLGRVPCRTVQIVGLIVGVQIFERRIRYTSMFFNIISSFSFLMEFLVDDGTAVIECHHHHRRPPPPPTTSSNLNHGPPHVPLKPISSVGTAVVIVGKVVTKFGGRELNVNTIGMKFILHYKHKITVSARDMLLIQ